MFSDKLCYLRKKIELNLTNMLLVYNFIFLSKVILLVIDGAEIAWSWFQLHNVIKLEKKNHYSKYNYVLNHWEIWKKNKQLKFEYQILDI